MNFITYWGSVLSAIFFVIRNYKCITIQNFSYPPFEVSEVRVRSPKARHYSSCERCGEYLSHGICLKCDKWRCHGCEYDNTPANIRCVMCHEKRLLK